MHSKEESLTSPLHTVTVYTSPCYCPHNQAEYYYDEREREREREREEKK
jgi:hypothetical protein